MSYFDHTYDEVLNEIGLITLEGRRTYMDLLFLHKLISGRIICSELLVNVKLHIPARSLRFNLIFSEEHHRTSYGRFKPLNRVGVLANKYSSRVDFFHPSLNRFKNSLLSCLR